MIIQEKPYYVDFVGNGASMAWGCNPVLNSGRCGVSSAQIIRVPSVGEYLEISAGGSVIRFSEARITRDELIEDIIENYTLLQYYDMSVSGIIVTFTCKSSSIETPVFSTNSETAMYRTVSSVPSIAPENKQGYGVLNYAEVTRCNRGIQETIQSDAFVVPVRENVGTVDLGFLSGFFEGVDLPSFSSSLAWSKLRYAWLQYVVHYGEYYNGTARRMFEMPKRYMLNGCSNDKGLNIPDWDSNIESGNQLSRCSKVQIFGMNNDSVHMVSRDAFFLLHLILFAENNNTSVAVRCTVNSVGVSGLEYSDEMDVFSIENNNIYSLKCSHSAVEALHGSDERLVQSSFMITQAGADVIEFVLQYREEEKDERLLLLQSRYGVLFPLSCRIVDVNVSYEGGSFTQGKYEQWSKDKVSRVNTARVLCGRDEAELIAAAAGNRFNYIIDGDSYVRIGIANDSIKVLDGDSNVLSVEFDFTTIYDERITEGKTLCAYTDDDSIEIPYNYNELFSISI